MRFIAISADITSIIHSMQLDYIATAKSCKCLSRLFFMTLEILHFLISGTVVQSRIKIVIERINVSKVHYPDDSDLSGG